MKLPKARRADIVVQELGRELLVYDLTTHNAYQLNETSMIVFNACDGVKSFDDLKSKYNFTDDLIYFALDELKDKNLLAANYQAQFAGLSRREVIRRVGLASMIALPIITGMVAPMPASAASAASGGCSLDADCFASPSTPYCNTATNTCVQCSADSNCPANTVCDAATSTCVQCTANSDCPFATPICMDNTCVA